MEEFLGRRVRILAKSHLPKERRLIHSSINAGFVKKRAASRFIDSESKSFAAANHFLSESVGDTFLLQDWAFPVESE